MLDLERELDQIRTALQSGGIEFALCGGLAMAVHGSPRATIDIDLLVLEEDIAPIESAVLPLGYAFHANPMKFSGGAVRIRGISKNRRRRSADARHASRYA
ncbi:MAG: nucleotidyl transferase AbiEii/AbiGii toxin family protein [Acidobacteriota bacterium]